MAERRFSLVFRGRIVDGADPEQTRADLARLFKADHARMARLFSGKPIVIKKDVDEFTARKYQAVLHKAGGLADIVAAGTSKPAAATRTAPRTEAVAPAAQTPPERAAEADPAAGRGAPASPPVAPAFGVAEPGALLVEAKPVPPAVFDTSGMDLAEVGVDLVEYKTVPEPEYDLSDLTLDPPGTLLAEPKKPPPAEFDTSALSLEDP